MVMAACRGCIPVVFRTHSGRIPDAFDASLQLQGETDGQPVEAADNFSF